LLAVNEVEVRLATAQDRPALQRMLELYQHDLSDIWDQDLDAKGEYGYELDRYWIEPACHPFVALVAGRYAGFALVDRAAKVGDDGYWMDQFFVLKKYRRAGVGRVLATRVFEELPGRWEVGQMTANAPARSFWRAVIADFTGGHFTEHALTNGWWQGTVQCFASPPGG
jgi:predicted acetyltransferase